METNSLCQYLNWDSDFFGFRIARITVNRLSQKDLEGVKKWCDLNSIVCLYFLCDSNDAATVEIAQDNQFRLVDIRLTLEKQISNIPIEENTIIQAVVRRSELDDVSTLRAIARVCHHDSRFYYDSNFPSFRCDELYEKWIEKSCNGYADVVLIAEFQGRPVGYITCILLDQAKGQIGLFGVDPRLHNKGLGQKLLNESLRWFVQQEVRQVTVVTQGRNLRAQRLYMNCGFLTCSLQLWYHHWFIQKRAKGEE